MGGTVHPRLGADPKIALIDEYGELDRQIQQFKPVLDRHEKIKQIIKSWYVDRAPEATDVIHGRVYEIQIGAREKERTWESMAKVVKAIGGPKVLMGICAVAIKSVEDLIGKTKTEDLLIERQTGSRRIKAILRTGVKPAEAA